MEETEFRNVDLELESGAALSLLIENLGEKIMVLSHDRIGDVYVATLEHEVGNFALSSDLQMFEADACIRAFLELIHRLPAPARAVWNNCRARIFDIGIAAGDGRNVFVQNLPASMVQAIASVGGAVRFTIYPLKP